MPPLAFTDARRLAALSAFRCRQAAALRRLAFHIISSCIARLRRCRLSRCLLSLAFSGFSPDTLPIEDIFAARRCFFHILPQRRRPPAAEPFFSFFDTPDAAAATGYAAIFAAITLRLLMPPSPPRHAAASIIADTPAIYAATPFSPFVAARLRLFSCRFSASFSPP